MMTRLPGVFNPPGAMVPQGQRALTWVEVRSSSTAPSASVTCVRTVEMRRPRRIQDASAVRNPVAAVGQQLGVSA